MSGATTTTTDPLAGLNPAQRRAAAHRGGPVAVLAGPGTGKTRVITHRIASLIADDGADPASILALTFTVKAADEMRSRLAELIGPGPADRVNAYTFHGLGRRLLLRFRDLAGYDREPTLIDSAQRLRAMREAISSLGISDASAARGWSVIADEATSQIAHLKNNAISPTDAAEFARAWRTRIEEGEFDDDERPRQAALCEEFAELANLYARFDEVCKARSWMTFEDLISVATDLLETPRVADIVHGEIRHTVVDEFQDVNLAQIELLRRLAPASERPDLCVVGDDDQSIYLFRDADDLAFKRFASTWTEHKVVELTDNYRAAPSLIATTNAVIARAEDRFAPDKQILPAQEISDAESSVECVQLSNDSVDGVQIAEMITAAHRDGLPLKDIAVIARTHGDLDRVAAAFEVSGIPAVKARRQSATDDEGVQVALAWIELLVDPAAVHATGRILVREPLSVDSQDFASMVSSYSAKASAHAINGEESPAPPSFARFVEQWADQSPGLAAFSRWYAQLHELSAKASAYDAVFRIIALTGIAHAELLPPRERASRVGALVTLLRFVHERLDRLEAPGDLAAFWSYYQDLDHADREMRDAGRDPIDGDADARFDPGIDAVRLVTAHSSKGLEFDTVFVPRVSPGHGYPRTSGAPPIDLPDGIVERENDTRDAKERQLAEERRIFYVTCTRAQRRLVLLARKTRTPSKSTHFFQELIFDPAMGDIITTVDEDQQHAAHRPQDQTPAPVESEVRRDVAGRAKDAARILAAQALHAADDPSVTPEALTATTSRLANAAIQMAISAHIQAHGRAPAWLSDATHKAWADALVESLGASANPTGVLYDPVSGPLKLSYTQIASYLDCPRCYYARYVLGVPDAPSASLQLGTVVHAALERFYRGWSEADATGQPTPGLKDLLAYGRDATSEVVSDTGVDESFASQVAAQLKLAFEKLHSEQSHVLAVEAKVVFPYVHAGATHRIEAKLDRIDQTDAGFRIVDYKTGHASKAKLSPPKTDLQLGMYALALPYHFEPDAIETPPTPAGVAEYWLLSTGQRGMIDLASLNLDKARQRIEQTIEGITSGSFDRGKACRGLCDVLGEPAKP